MEKIGNLKDIPKGTSLNFQYNGQKAILVRPNRGNPSAYLAICPHEAGNIEWDKQTGMLLCECHLSLFNPSDGSVKKQSSVLEKIQGLTKININVDEHEDIFAL
jgi:nitrite reductase/ring-hydroxylating ferredoxin subunit